MRVVSLNAAHACRVVDSDGRGVTVAHFHGVRMASGKSDTRERRRQAEHVVALVSRVRHASYLLVSDRRAVASFEVLAAPEVSDHRPLVLDLQPA